MHALIVDDSKTARYALRQLLDKQKVSADMVESAEEALDYLGSRSPSDDVPDLIFMDHMMPGMDGFEAVKALKSNPSTAAIPIVMYTSTQGGMYFGQARALGAADVISKPATAEDLREVLRRLQENRKVAASKPVVTAPVEVQTLYTEPPLAVQPAGAANGGDDAALFVESDAPGRASRAGYWLAALLLLPLLYFGAQYLQLERDSRALRERQGTALKAIEWALGQSTEFGYGEAPFNAARVRQLQELLTHLHGMAFRGRVVVEGHVGVFCLQRDSGGNLVRAVADVPLTECVELGQGMPLQEAAAAETAEFRRFLQDSPLLDDAIQVEIRARGAESPLLEYSSGMRSLEWNRTAQRNQRVRILLEPAAAAGL
jgi:CheY-like chemotaxis protein